MPREYFKEIFDTLEKERSLKQEFSEKLTLSASVIMLDFSIKNSPYLILITN